jgi:selenium metabolism protein YedF
MDQETVILFTANGLGHGPEDLSSILVKKYLSLLLEAGWLPSKLLFYTDGVKLACEGSPVVDQLLQLENQGVEIILCKTCLDYFNLSGSVKVGVIGGMGDILEAMQRAGKVVTV